MRVKQEREQKLRELKAKRLKNEQILRDLRGSVLNLARKLKSKTEGIVERGRGMFLEYAEQEKKRLKLSVEEEAELNAPSETESEREE